MEFIGQILMNGAVLSAFYGIIAVGLTLLFGVMRIFNFAHGELYMVGAYGVWLLYGRIGLPFFAAVVVSILVVGVLGIIIERGLFRPLRANPMAGFIGSVGIVFMLQVVVGQIWGVGFPKPVALPYPMVLEFFGIHILLQRLIVIPVGFALLGGLWLFLQRMKVGQALRAYAQDAETASLQGININRVSVIAVVLGCALAGAAGAFMAPLIGIDPYMGSRVILKAFIIVIIGGVGSIEGSIVAALLFGFLDSAVTTMVDSTVANVTGLAFMVVILAIRPRGLLGHG